MKKILLITALSMSCAGIFAQSLTDKDLNEIRSSLKKRCFYASHSKHFNRRQKHKRECAEPGIARKNRPFFQIPGQCERNYRSAQLRTLLDVHFHECTPAFYHGEIQFKSLRFFTQLYLLLGYF